MSTHTEGKLLRALAALLWPLFFTASLRAQGPQLEFESGHHESIRAIAVSADEKYLASAGADRRIILWDVAAGKQLCSLTGHSEWITALSFSRDGQSLVSLSADNRVKLWDVARGKERYEIPPSLRTLRVAMSADGGTLALIGEEKTIKLWDVAARKMKAELSGHTAQVTQVAFLDDGSLISSSLDGTLRVWNLAVGESMVAATLGKPIESFAVSRDYIACVGSISISVLDAHTKKPRGTIPLGVSSSFLEQYSLTFVSHKELAYLYASTLIIWDVEAGKEVLRRSSSSGGGTHATAATGRGALLAYSDGSNINLLNLLTKETRMFSGGYSPGNGVAFHSNGLGLVVALSNRALFLGGWMSVNQQESYKELYTRMTETVSHNNVFLPSVNLIAHLEPGPGGFLGPDIVLTGILGSTTRELLKGHTKPVYAMALNPEGTLLASCSEDATVRLWDVKTRTLANTLQEHAHLIAFSPDGKFLATVAWDGSIKLWDVKTWEHKVLPAHGTLNHILFSPDGTVLAGLSSGKTILLGLHQRSVVLWDIPSGTYLHSMEADASRPSPSSRPAGTPSDHLITSSFAGLVHYPTAAGPMAFSQDGNLIACEGRNPDTAGYDIKVWRVRTGEQLHAMSGHYSTIRSLSFSPKRNILASASWDNTVRLWDADKGQELATIIPLNQNTSLLFAAFTPIEWVIFTPDGRFDTSARLEEVKRLHWVMPGDVLSPLPLDVFMRDYYEPGLLDRVLTGTALKPVRDISTLNRTQPEVVIKDVKSDGAGTVEVEVEVANAVSRKQFDARGRALESGVYDVRLFRDGQLIGSSTAEDALGTYFRAMRDLAPAARSGEAELSFWRQSHQVRLDGNGRRTLVFRHIRLPQGGKTKEVGFSAYAFNNDRVKSSTAHKSYALPPAAAGARKGRAYVVTVGVNLYENPAFNLSYAANDARRMQQALTSRLTATGQYDEVVAISLISDAATAQTDATKANFRAVLRLLAGEGGASQELRGIQNADRLKAAGPDDLIVLHFSGHGFAGPKGLFYLVPYDTGAGRGRVVTRRLQQRSISSEELSLWLRDVDAGHMTLIVDACYSAAAVENEEFKPGPLGSRGLGQLAYDKGMLILTATQADKLAHEGRPIRQGLLSYVLAREGLEEMKADFRPADGVLTLREWLQYGLMNVPRLFDEIVAGKTTVFDRDVFVDGAGHPRAVQQQPSLFDFARRDVEVTLASAPARR